MFRARLLCVPGEASLTLLPLAKLQPCSGKASATAEVSVSRHEAPLPSRCRPTFPPRRGRAIPQAIIDSSLGATLIPGMGLELAVCTSSQLHILGCSIGVSGQPGWRHRHLRTRQVHPRHGPQRSTAQDCHEGQQAPSHRCCFLACRCLKKHKATPNTATAGLWLRKP